ncbi:MAG: HAMP domain-containing protein [Gammaproteobacteria bacterium]|nr:HAMP domain-containing protein [Gammaproteobacteria bacterium]
MHSLFLKIFLSFWIALIVFSGLSLWATSHYLDTVRSEEVSTRPWQRLMLYLHEAQTIANDTGEEGLRQWLTQLDEREAIPFYLLDNRGHDLLRRSVPTRIQSLFQTVSHLPHPRTINERENDQEYPLHHRPIVIVQGHYYRLVPDYLSVTLGRVLKRPRLIGVPLIIAALVSGLVCLILARYLSLPILRLQHASRRLAAGDLSLRVAPTMGKRKDEIAQLALDFDHMAEQLERLINSHKQLLRDASHELRSPLARLQVAMGLVRQRGDRPNAADIDRMERETERLNDLVGQLLSLSRLEAGIFAVDREPIDMADLIRTIADDAAFEAHAMQRDVVVTQLHPLKIIGDSILLHSAIENVVRNAIRYTAPGTAVELSFEPTTQRPGWATLRIRDHGPGIPATMLTRIFEPFVRVSEARDRPSGGYGLGLAIAQRAVRLHGGEMQARNETEGGLSILIHLPTS